MLYFVYGTLKRGFPNHRILYKENFIAHTTTEGILYENGIPYFVPDEKYVGLFGLKDFKEDVDQVLTQKRKAPAIEFQNRVYGETYEVYHEDTWSELDRLEGYRGHDVHGLYDRFLYSVLIDGKFEWAWTYGLRNGKEKMIDAVPVKSGIYTKVY